MTVLPPPSTWPSKDGPCGHHAERELVDRVRTVDLRRRLERDAVLLRRVEVWRAKLVAGVQRRLRRVQGRPHGAPPSSFGARLSTFWRAVSAACSACSSVSRAAVTRRAKSVGGRPTALEDVIQQGRVNTQGIGQVLLRETQFGEAAPQLRNGWHIHHLAQMVNI